MTRRDAYAQHLTDGAASPARMAAAMARFDAQEGPDFMGPGAPEAAKALWAEARRLQGVADSELVYTGVDLFHPGMMFGG